MKHNTTQITAELLKELLHYNPETGIFTWAKSIGQRAQVGRTAGTRTPSGYIKISLSRKLYSARRLAWLYMTGSWPENEIDHVDNNLSNNVFSNLRAATKSQNAQNRGNRRGTKSRYKGVRFDSQRNKWVACIWLHSLKKEKRIGFFSSEEEAAKAYRAEAEVLHGEYFKVPEYQR
ncbi:TPA: HNH endonuclease [Enterobacter soli]|nr:HNH endonuclease [Enterobacter soli]